MRRGLRAALGLALTVAVIAFAIAWLSGAFVARIEPGAAGLEAALLPADTATATVAQITDVTHEWTSGTLASAQRTSVASRVLARIEEVSVRAGDLVRQGDVLIKLDARDLEARVRQAEDALSAARAERDLARTERDRAQDLFGRGVATRQRLDRATARLNVATANVDRLTRQLEETRTALSYAAIESPVDGRVIDRLAEPGDTATPGEVLLRIYDPSVLRVETPVPESLAVTLSLGQAVRVEIPSLGYEAEGAIDEIVPFAEVGARTMLVKVRVPAGPRLIAGMYARVAIPAGERTRLVAPAAAIARIGQLEFAIVVGPGGAAQRRLVTTGARLAPDQVEILSGLAAAERIALPKP